MKNDKPRLLVKIWSVILSVLERNMCYVNRSTLINSIRIILVSRFDVYELMYAYLIVFIYRFIVIVIYNISLYMSLILNMEIFEIIIFSDSPSWYPAFSSCQFLLFCSRVFFHFMKSEIL